MKNRCEPVNRFNDPRRVWSRAPWRETPSLNKEAFPSSCVKETFNGPPMTQIVALWRGKSDNRTKEIVRRCRTTHGIHLPWVFLFAYNRVTK